MYPMRRNLVLLLCAVCLVLIVIENNFRPWQKRDDDNGVDINMLERDTYTVNQSRCKPKDVQPSKTQLPPIGLVSFPGSGNTWTRHLIEQMTGNLAHIEHFSFLQLTSYLQKHF